MFSNCSGSAHVKIRSVIRLSLAISAASILRLGPSFVLVCAKIFVWDWASPPALVCPLPKINVFFSLLGILGQPSIRHAPAMLPARNINTLCAIHSRDFLVVVAAIVESFSTDDEHDYEYEFSSFS